METSGRIGGVIAAYRIEALIGRGGMGLVYRATHVALGRPVALKIISPDLAEDEDFRERFVREARLAASLDHPNIIPIYDAGEAGGDLYIAMRHVEGPDLRAILKEEHRLPPERTLSILAQVASALDAAHAKGLVHRDVKPANILVTEGEGGDRVYLTDFGLTKRTDSTTSLTHTGAFVGTLDYAAPEQIQARPVDGRADQYALGCLVYHCLAGQAPFRRDTDVQVMYAHLHDPAPSLWAERPDLSPGLDAVISRALAKAPDDRFSSCGAFVQAVEDALGGTSRAAFPPRAQRAPSVSSPARRPRRAFRRVSLVAVPLAVAIVALVALVLVRHDGQPPTRDASQDGAGAPLPPSGVRATPRGQSAIRLTWADNASDEDAYMISIENGLSFSIGANSEATVVGGLATDTRYCFRVEAVNAAGSAGSPLVCAQTPPPILASPGSPTPAPTGSPPSTFPPGPAPPAAPTNLGVTATSASTVVLRWDDRSANEGGFRILLEGTLSATVGPNVTTFRFAGLKPGNHCFSVFAFSSTGASRSNTVCVSLP